jgi:hypothetical protein
MNGMDTMTVGNKERRVRVAWSGCWENLATSRLSTTGTGRRTGATSQQPQVLESVVLPDPAPLVC